MLLAYRDVEKEPECEEEDPLVSDLTVCGFVGIQDPQRPEVLGAVEVGLKLFLEKFELIWYFRNVVELV